MDARRSVAMPRISPSRRARAAAVLLVAAPFAFVALAGLRAWRIERNAGDYTGCHGCFHVAALGHDAWLLAAMLGLLAIGCSAGTRWMRATARSLAVLILLLVAADVAVDALLAQRLYFADVLRFGRNPGADFSVLRAALASAQGRFAAVAGAGLLVVCAGTLAAGARRPRVAAGFLAGALACLGFGLFAHAHPVQYVHRLLVYNVIEANLPQGRVKGFSAAHLQAGQALAERLPETCEQAAADDTEIVIVLVESLSAWHSRLLGGDDWMPKLDAIARANHYFTHFYANGFTTSTGEIAVIGGRVPFNPPGEAWLRFANYADPQGSLADVAHRAGHQAAFFTTGDLGFLDLGPWLRELGFDVVDGSESPFYSGMRRWQFGAAEDSALYARYLDWLDTRTDTRPAVSVLLTVSSHPPFVDPRSGKIDPQASFAYVDAQIDAFHSALEARGFFGHGILLVLGDHRTMTPLRDEEYRRWGERAFARVPLVVAGAVDMPAVVDTPFQQTDLATSIAYRLGLRACRNAFAGSFLRPDPQPARYVVHVRGDDRNRVDVYHGSNAVAGYRLDGDASGWIGPKPPDAGAVAGWIDTQRQRAASAAAAHPTAPGPAH
jgi:hypothetical protein